MFAFEQRFSPNRLSGVAFLQRWAVTTVGVLVAAHVVRGLSYDSFAGLLVASLLLGALNAFLRPLLLVFSLPLIVASFGLWVLVINALLLYVVGALVKSFHVAGFWAAFWGGVVISLVSLAGYLAFGGSRFKASFNRPGLDPAPHRRPPPGDGPVIDV
jgi:putative membrane protein